MKKSQVIWIASSLAFAPLAKAAGIGYQGFYLGAKAGVNDSSTSGAANQSVSRAFVGVEGGYGWLLSDTVLLGGDVWGDNHRKSVTGRDYGADVKVGNVENQVMYYIKLGVAATNPGDRLQYGIGLEYKYDLRLGVLVEWTGDSISKDNVNYRNNNYVVGLTYHF